MVKQQKRNTTTTTRHQTTDLLVDELPGVLLNMSLIQVGGHVHQANLRQAEVGQFDVSHGGDQQTTEEEDT